MEKKLDIHEEIQKLIDQHGKEEVITVIEQLVGLDEILEVVVKGL
ncbi:hypothetical protein ACFPOG_12890 [Paenibacillus aestuarii]|uniref:Uncharacterized protein n=1 Tax=Paenibacillus aestuarii TaxID=516965 RepID=A0ABW0K9D7_9BACL